MVDPRLWKVSWLTHRITSNRKEVSFETMQTDVIDKWGNTYTQKSNTTFYVQSFQEKSKVRKLKRTQNTKCSLSQYLMNS